MRVLVTADTIGGVWTYTRELVTGLSRRGVDVVLVSFGEIPSAAQSDWLDGLKNVDYRATAFKLEWMQDSLDDLRASSGFLMDVVRETRPHLLHLSQYFHGALNVNVPKIVVAHSDVVSWWMEVHGVEPPQNDWTIGYRDVVTTGLAGADVVVAPSRWMLDAATRHYGPLRNGTVIYNGRNPGLFNPHGSKEDLAISVGRVWDKAKNVSILAEASHSVPVWIAGEETNPEANGRPNNSSLRGRGVRLCGKQSESQLRHLFSRASMYVATSQYEPFGLALAEAALSRCALIANDIPVFRELWGECACYYSPNDSQDLARKIDQLQHDKELRMTYANLAYRRAQQRFTAERMVSDYINLYQTLVPAGAAVA